MSKTSKKVFNMALATTMAAGAVVAVAPAQADAAKVFPDVKNASSSHYNNIYSLVERGIIQGYEDGTFRPSESIERGHAAKIIAGVLGLDTKNVTNPGFKDISTKNPYYGAIAALANAGIIDGFEDNTYRHNATLTRGQLSKIIANAFELEVGNIANPFTDVKNSQYVNYITALFANGVTTGKTATTFDAKSPVTRAQLATFVVRAENVKAAPEQTVTAKISEVTATTVVTDKGTFAIEGDLAKVFNAANAAALKDAEIQVVVENQVTASINFVAAEGKNKLVGIKSLKLVADNATFNAGGFEIPQLTVSGKNLTVENVKAAKLTVGQGLTLTLKNVDVAEIDVTKGAKITLDAASKIGKVILPKNLKITDVITNYNQVKDLIKEITVDQNATAPISGGGGGGGNDDTPPQTKTVTIETVTDTEITTSDGKVYAIEGDLAKVFNADNAAALEGAEIEVVVENELTASLNFIAATGKLTSLKSLTLNANTNATFNAGGFEIPNLTVNGNGLTIENVKAKTLIVDANVEIINVTSETVTIGANIDVILTRVTVTINLVLSANTVLTLDDYTATAVVNIEVPKGVEIGDIISNYEQVEQAIKNKVKESTDNPTEAIAATQTVNKLITAMVGDTNTIYSEYGSLTDETAPSFIFTFNSGSTELQVIKNNVEGFGSSLEDNVVNLVNSSNVGHLLNIEEIKATSGGKETSVLRGIPENTPLNEVEKYITNELSQVSVAGVLDNFMSHDEARDATVSEFVTDYSTFNIIVTFSDDSKLNYTLTLDVKK